MIKLMKYVQSISDKEDMRNTNTEIFQLHKIYNTDIENFIEYYDFDNLVDSSSSSSEEEKQEEVHKVEDSDSDHAGEEEKKEISKVTDSVEEVFDTPQRNQSCSK